MTVERPKVIVFDVNETLSDMRPMAERFSAAGADPALARLWFATLLRDGFALTAAGDSAHFADIGGELLKEMLRDAGVPEPDDTANTLVAAVAELPLHPDVPDGIRTLRSAGYRLVTLTNGSARVAERLFTQAGIRDEFEQLLTVEDAQAWKPHPASYAYAAERCGVGAADMLLVAVHPWDIHGAARAGLRTAWINRGKGAYPSYFAAPELEVDSLTALASLLTAG